MSVRINQPALPADLVRIHHQQAEILCRTICFHSVPSWCLNATTYSSATIPLRYPYQPCSLVGRLREKWTKNQRMTILAGCRGSSCQDSVWMMRTYPMDKLLCRLSKGLVLSGCASRREGRSVLGGSHVSGVVTFFHENYINRGVWRPPSSRARRESMAEWFVSCRCHSLEHVRQ